MSDETILAFENVTLAVQPPYETGLVGVSFSLRRGDWLSIRIEEGLARIPFADAAEGVVDPDAGRVAFLGEDWRMMSPNRSAERRGKIGRVFETHAWISNLDVDENITLVQRHHTARPEDEIAREAEALVWQFGLEGLPRVRPAVVRRSDLRRAEWARAFIGEPQLIILENPTKDVYLDALPALLDVVKAARERGAAVIWMTDDVRALLKVAPESTHTFEFRGAGLVLWEGT
jgi:phospholipid/cholesterol/gamma-HCH transport system ATP-binding protein